MSILKRAAAAVCALGLSVGLLGCQGSPQHPEPPTAGPVTSAGCSNPQGALTELFRGIQGITDTRVSASEDLCLTGGSFSVTLEARNANAEQIRQILRIFHDVFAQFESTLRPPPDLKVRFGEFTVWFREGAVEPSDALVQALADAAAARLEGTVNVRVSSGPSLSEATVTMLYLSVDGARSGTADFPREVAAAWTNVSSLAAALGWGSGDIRMNTPPGDQRTHSMSVEVAAGSAAPEGLADFMQQWWDFTVSSRALGTPHLAGDATGTKHEMTFALREGVDALPADHQTAFDQLADRFKSLGIGELDITIKAK